MTDVDPLSAYLIDDSGAASIDLDQFVTTVGASLPVEQSAGGGPEDAPVITYDDGDVLPIVLPLFYQPSVDGVHLKEIHLRPPEQEDIEAWVSGEIKGNREMMSRMTGLHPDVLRRLKWPDAARLHQIFSTMIPDFMTED